MARTTNAPDFTSTLIKVLIGAFLAFVILRAFSCSHDTQSRIAGTETVVRDHYETVRVQLPPLRVVSEVARWRIEHDTIIDTAIVRSLVATLDTARSLLRARGVRSTFTMDTSIAPFVERLVVICDETNRSIAVNATFRPIDTVVRFTDTITAVTLWQQPLLEPYVQAAAIVTGNGQWSAQAAAGARLNVTRQARGFVDGQIELGGLPRLRLGIDISF